MTVTALKTERAEINEQAVALLKRVLEDARNGEIIAVGLAMVRPSGHVNCGFTDYDVAGVLLGAVALLQSRLIASMVPKE